MTSRPSPRSPRPPVSQTKPTSHERHVDSSASPSLTAAESFKPRRGGEATLARMSAPVVFAVLAVALFLKLVALISVQGVVRLRSRRYAQPEDAACWTGEHDDHPVAQQAQLALRNDGENVPLFLALQAAYLTLHGPPGVALAIGAVFVATRWLHGVVYVWPRQPARTLTYGVGLVCMIALAGLCLAEIGTGAPNRPSRPRESQAVRAGLSRVRHPHRPNSPHFRPGATATRQIVHGWPDDPDSAHGLLVVSGRAVTSITPGR
ncbi:MAG: MAPEG family protein [Myxococcales bacterium FL481]|nr:MAG: MAPEG family protein [Myxococcales bacterium FL481]